MAIAQRRSVVRAIASCVLLVVAGLSTAGSNAMAQVLPYRGSYSCDCEGTGGSFASIVAVATGAAGEVHALSAFDHLMTHSGTGAFATAWRVSPASSGGLHATPDLVVNSSGELLIVDGTTEQIRRMSGSGVEVQVFGGSGGSPTVFQNLAGIAIGPAGLVYGSDSQQFKVARFTSGGTFMDQWTATNGTGGLVGPTHIAVDDSGNVFVAGDRALHKYSQAGTHLVRWGGVGSGPGQFGSVSEVSPNGMAVGPDGLLYVTDSPNHRIQVFNTMGVYQYEFGAEGDGPYLFGSLGKPAFDALGNLYIPDAVNQKVHKYGPGPVPAKQSSWGAVKTRYR